MVQTYFFLFKRCKKFFQKPLHIQAGRNFRGRLCVQHQGGSDKHNIILVDRFRFVNAYGLVLRIIDDFYRTAFVGLVLYDNGLANFILICEGVLKNALVFSGHLKILQAPVGSTQNLSFIKLFDAISSIELFPRSGAVLARAAGVFSKIISRNRHFVILKLNSGWQYKVSVLGLAALGISSNLSFRFKPVGKAGLQRMRGIRPTVRGVIKNPCDHPHGGGEGKGSPPVAQVSP